MKTKFIVLIQCMIGFLFLLSGISKCIDILGFQRLIFQYGFPELHWFAPFIVIAEVAIGTLFLIQIKNKALIWCTFAMMTMFTLVFTYAYIVNGVEDCGCFGNFNILPKSPITVYVRNVIILSALLFLAFDLKRNKTTQFESWQKRILLTVLFPTVFISGMTYRPYYFTVIEHEYKGRLLSSTELYKYVHNANGKSWITFITPNCHHCWNSISNIKSYKDSRFFDEVNLYMLFDDTVNANMDSIKNVFHENYGDVDFTTLLKSETDFVNAYPTSFFIRHDTIVEVLEQEVPSLLTFKRIYLQNKL